MSKKRLQVDTFGVRFVFLKTRHPSEVAFTNLTRLHSANVFRQPLWRPTTKRRSPKRGHNYTCPKKRFGEKLEFRSVDSLWEVSQGVLALKGMRHKVLGQYPQAVQAFCNQLTLNPALCAMTRRVQESWNRWKRYLRITY